MFLKILVAVLAAALPAAVSAAWQTINMEQGRHVEIDRESIVHGPGGSLLAKGRVVFDRPIVDPKSSVSYHIIEFETRYDCAERTRVTLKRTYYTADNSLLRQDEVQGAFELPVRSGTPDGILMREVCRTLGDGSAPRSLNQALGTINELAADLRQSNDALVKQAVEKDRQRAPRQPASAVSGRQAARPAAAEARRAPSPNWSYEDAAGPEHWGQLSPNYAVCASGKRQSPIDLSDAFSVDLQAIQFLYQAAPFHVVDTGRHLQLTIDGSGYIQTLGKIYRLIYIRFHSPAEFTVVGRAFPMEAQLVHSADDGKLAIVSVLLEMGSENPVIQAALNNFPLEKSGETAPPGHDIDINALLPADSGYFTFMGSLTTPPCTEGVLWMVLKQPRQVSAEQLSMLRRLYRPNARPVQPAFGRIVKESR
ncbi:MAG: carbonic anhydrase family protein [Candidatus Accumulibacter sp.]|nr:carbonic anhydrase family protein [Accumulibacter sp.]